MKHISKPLGTLELEAIAARGRAILGANPPPASTPPTPAASPGEPAGDCPDCHGAGFLRRLPPGPDLGQPAAVVMCPCRRQEAAGRAAARLASSLGRLRDARWTDLVAGERWTAEERRSFEACRAAALRFAGEPHYALVLAGPPGNGKTTLLGCVAGDLLAKGRTPLFAKVPDLLDRLRESFRPGPERGEPTFDALYEDLKRADVLLLDDLGTENPTPWALEKLYQLVDHRYAHRLPLGVTTNLRPETLNSLSQRIYSRLAGHIVVNRTPDHRLEAG